jgi:hypothetical protein
MTIEALTFSMLLEKGMQQHIEAHRSPMLTYGLAMIFSPIDTARTFKAELPLE